MQTDQNNRREWLAVALGILLVSGLSYLIFIQKLGFYFDDWYLVYAGLVKGSGQFIKVFEIDRPFRAFFVGPVFDWFGLNVQRYHYLSYLLRIAGGFGMFWLVRLVWPAQSRLGVLLAAMFVVYPGWTDQPAAFDYQSHLLSFGLLVFSLALTAKTFRTGRRGLKFGLTIAAILTQIAALLLMEYYIGLEGLRLGLIVLLALGPGFPLSALRERKNLLRIAAAWLPYLLGASAFFIWRSLLFKSTRAATDIQGMFSALLNDPLSRWLDMLLNLFRDFINVVFLAWVVPYYNLVTGLDLGEAIAAAGVGIFAALGLGAIYAWANRGADPNAEALHSPRRERDGLEMMAVGALGVIFSLLPILLGQRHIVFMSFTRFTLPGSIGATLLIGGLLVAFTRRPLRTLVPLGLIFFACAFHYSNSLVFAENWVILRSFWWQMTWRAPMIEEGTVLAVEYAAAPINEDYFVWGPANIIYYPELHERDGLVYTPIGAVVLVQENVLDILQKRQQAGRERRGLLTPQSLDGKVLVASMPTGGSCVEVFDGNQVEISDRTSHRAARIAPMSVVSRILTEGPTRVPPAALFGPEPAHEFCYYYQRASLERQRGNWEEVARLGDAVVAGGHRPAEWVDWMPFVQGWAYTGQYPAVDAIAAQYRGVPFLHDQACYLFREDYYQNGRQFPQGQRYLIETFCE